MGTALYTEEEIERESRQWARRLTRGLLVQGVQELANDVELAAMAAETDAHNAKTDYARIVAESDKASALHLRGQDRSPSGSTVYAGEADGLNHRRER